MRAQSEGVTDFIPKPFSQEELLPRVRALVMLKLFADEHEHAEHVILTLAKTIDARDPYTAGHSGRVAEYADRIATRMGLDAAARNDMRRGALFHDLGKIVIPDAVLRKPGAPDAGGAQDHRGAPGRRARAALCRCRRCARRSRSSTTTTSGSTAPATRRGSRATRSR